MIRMTLRRYVNRTVSTPPLLGCAVTKVAGDDTMGVRKRRLSFMERDVMLGLVFSILVVVPFKFRGGHWCMLAGINITCHTFVWFSDATAMIRSLRHMGSERFFQKSDLRGINPRHGPRIRRMLELIDHEGRKKRKKRARFPLIFRSVSMGSLPESIGHQSGAYCAWPAWRAVPGRCRQ